MDLKALEHQLTDNLPPVDQWNPNHCGEIDIVIDRDGKWIHEGSEIKREALVKLFCRVLRKEDNSFFLVTPVEKMKIKVEMEPFILVDADFEDGIWVFKTKTNEKIPLTKAHPMELALGNSLEKYPRVLVRNGLWAHFHRNLFFRMAEQTTVVETGNKVQWRLESANKKWLFGED